MDGHAEPKRYNAHSWRQLAMDSRRDCLRLPANMHTGTYAHEAFKTLALTMDSKFTGTGFD